MLDLIHKMNFVFIKSKCKLTNKGCQKLIKKLGSRDWHVWNSASEKLVNAGPMAAESLIAVLNDSVHNPYYVRERTAEILGKIGD
ncbi:MAG: hypothetical protein GY749_38910 [Desulfobacteraceae bacterium]|nr:hypothetical protein [Desulfobacteraceae bacterium]